MAAERTTPIDPFTGMIYPILPREPDPELPIDNPEVANEHHAHHKKADYQTVALNGYRNSQIQIVEAELHNMSDRAYHTKYRGRRPPTNLDTVFRRTFWRCVGLMTHMGIDMSGDEPVEREMTEPEQAFFHTLHPEDEFAYKYIQYRYEPIRDFFREYVFSRPLAKHQARVEAFLFAENEEEKRSHGRFLIRQATYLAVDPIREQYTQFRDAGRLHPAMPNRPDDVMRYKFGREDDQTEAENLALFENVLLTQRNREIA